MVERKFIINTKSKETHNQPITVHTWENLCEKGNYICIMVSGNHYLIKWEIKKKILSISFILLPITQFCHSRLHHRILETIFTFLPNIETGIFFCFDFFYPYGFYILIVHFLTFLLILGIYIYIYTVQSEP